MCEEFLIKLLTFSPGFPIGPGSPLRPGSPIESANRKLCFVIKKNKNANLQVLKKNKTHFQNISTFRQLRFTFWTRFSCLTCLAMFTGVTFLSLISTNSLIPFLPLCSLFARSSQKLIKLFSYSSFNYPGSPRGP